MDRRATLALVALAAVLPCACVGWSDLRHVAAPTASFDRVARTPAAATFAVARGSDAPVCYEFSGVYPSDPTCVDGLRSHVEDALESLLSDFLTRTPAGATPDFVASLELTRVDHLTGPHAAGPYFTAAWRATVRDRCGAVVIDGSRTTRTEPHFDLYAGLRDVQVDIVRQVRTLLSESLLATIGTGAPTSCGPARPAPSGT